MSPLRRLAFVGVLVVFMAMASGVHAEEATVPPSVKVALVAKLADYDKNFVARAGDRAHILIVTMKGDVDSARVSGQLRAAFAETDRVGGLPHDETVIEYGDAKAIARACVEQHVSIVYLTPGLAGEVEAIGRALDGVSVWSVGAISGYAARGAMIDFFIEGGKPKVALTSRKRANSRSRWRRKSFAS